MNTWYDFRWQRKKCWLMARNHQEKFWSMFFGITERNSWWLTRSILVQTLYTCIQWESGLGRMKYQSLLGLVLNSPWYFFGFRLGYFFFPFIISDFISLFSLLFLFFPFRIVETIRKILFDFCSIIEHRNFYSFKIYLLSMICFLDSDVIANYIFH